MKSFIRLDFIRGIAAIMVLAGHLRALIFNDYSQQHAVPAIGKVFFFLTGFGHQAVVIFFVLSGFFITKSIVGAMKKNQWSVRVYAIHRLSRLWVVLVPGLLLALALDQFGLHYLSHPAYYGKLEFLPEVNPSTHISPQIFFGNIFFVQTLLVPTFGSDGALWSLCNEFWYYCFLPLLLLPLFTPKKNAVTIIICLLALIGLNILLFQLLVGFFIFLMGAACYLFYKKFKAFGSLPSRILGLIIFFCTLGFTRLATDYPPSLTDTVLGIAFTIFLLTWLNAPNPTNKFFTRSAEFLSGFSYTVYVIHLPVALFCCACLHLYYKPFTYSMLGEYLGLFIAILLFARLFYWLFERNTGRLRKWLEGKQVSHSIV